MHTLKNKTEQKICKILGFHYGKITNCGSEAIKYCLINANIKIGTYVIVPVTICKSVVDVIFEYGCLPLFIDVNEDFCIDVKNVIRNYNKQVSAMIYVHAYGILKDINDLVSYCKNNAICLIEDSAQYICENNRYCNCQQGDFVVYSFGKGKPVDVGGLGFIASNNLKITRFPILTTINSCEVLNKKFDNLPVIINEKKRKAKEYKKYFKNLTILNANNFLDNVFHRLLVYYPRNYYKISKKMYFYMNDAKIDNYQSTIPIESFRETSTIKRLPKQHHNLSLTDFPVYSKLKKSIHYFRTSEWINDSNIKQICDEFLKQICDEV